MISVSSNFDGGNIEVIDCSQPGNIRLAIRKDHQSDFYQWFYFRLTGAAGQDCRIVIENAAGAAYADGWEHYRAVASSDRDYWYRVDTDYRDGQLKMDIQPDSDSLWLAYFAPYPTERHHDLVAGACSSPLVQYRKLGETLDGQDMDLLEITAMADTGNARHYWVIARQHPGETMAEWWMEGFLGRLLDEDDPVSRALLQQAVFHVVPNMNPDGSRRGHLRTNAAGANLNREWAEPSAGRSPEVLQVRQAMMDSGVDFSLDVHGDEALPHNFIAGAEGVPGWSDRLAALQDAFEAALLARSPDFQVTYGYERDAPNSSDLRKCTDWVAQQFDCLSMTLEMPFKDTSDQPMPETGWSPERCRLLGAASLGAMLAVLEDLR